MTGNAGYLGTITVSNGSTLRFVTEINAAIGAGQILQQNSEDVPSVAVLTGGRHSGFRTARERAGMCLDPGESHSTGRIWERKMELGRGIDSAWGACRDGGAQVDNELPHRRR